MATITEDYVSFETAKLLKKKGFHESTVCVYHKCGTFDQITLNAWNDEFITPICAPTLQMAMKWLREVHKLYVEVYTVKSYKNKTVEYCITIEDLNFPGSDDGIFISPSQESYEEACEVGIKYCLEHLV